MKRWQKGDQLFIKAVSKAIITSNTRKTHVLYDVKGVRKYISSTNDDYDYEEHNPDAKCICVASPSFITDLHYKAGSNDEEARKWAKQAIKDMIRDHEKVSKYVYDNYNPELKQTRINPKEFLDSLSYDGMDERAKNEYQLKMLQSFKQDDHD
jgi:hypothetical protein